MEISQQMQRWAEDCPENFLHKYCLVEAEIARIEGRQWEAVTFYRKAIEAARQHEFLRDEALANELLAKFWLAQNEETDQERYSVVREDRDNDGDGEINEDALYASSQITDSPSVTPDLNYRISSIYRAAHQVIDSEGKRYAYNKLVLATGSHAHIPVIDGVQLNNVFRFRDLHDAMSLMGRSVMTRSTVVIGGGLLGLEAAKSMQRYNTDVHVVEHDMWLMFKQLDETAGAYLREHIEQSGIQVHTGKHVQQIIGRHKVEGVIYFHRTATRRAEPTSRVLTLDGSAWHVRSSATCRTNVRC